MRMHIVVSDKVDGKSEVIVDAYANIKMTTEDAAVWATNCLYQAARYAASTEEDDDDEVIVVDADGNHTSRAKPLMRDIYLKSVPDDTTELEVFMVKACAFTQEQATEGLRICKVSGVELKLAENIPPDVAILMLEDLEKLGCVVRMI